MTPAHITSLGFQLLRVTNDWIKQAPGNSQLTEKHRLEEVVIRPFNLTGYLEVDIKLSL
jgi:hypothetical protein